MARLNPSFELDFADINSYDQIQLLNDTLAVRRQLSAGEPPVYVEPSDDSAIRQNFAAFTFVDFCPRPLNVDQAPTSTSTSSASSNTNNQKKLGTRILRCHELENLCDLFDRANLWLSVNSSWRALSVESLEFDATTRFKVVKSAIATRWPPRNTRGLRLWLAPAKSRFSAAQRICCINVVPRFVANSNNTDRPTRLETVDELLERLNALLIERPIKGKILSVETVQLPMLDGFVEAEASFCMDARLNAAATAASKERLVDVLRVFYETGNELCGLVGLLDFAPLVEGLGPDFRPAATVNGCVGGIGALSTTREPLTRLVQRSLAAFDLERKQQAPIFETNSNFSQPQPRFCSLQVCNKLVLASDAATCKLPTRSVENAPRRVGCVEASFVRLAFVVPLCELCIVNNQNSSKTITITQQQQQQRQDKTVNNIALKAAKQRLRAAYANHALCVQRASVGAPVGSLAHRLFAPCRRVAGSSRDETIKTATTTKSTASSSFRSFKKWQPTSDLSPALGAFAARTLRPRAKAILDDFESVAAMRRRIQVYVTTNAMKVVSANTLVVRLRLDSLSASVDDTLVAIDDDDNGCEINGRHNDDHHGGDYDHGSRVKHPVWVAVYLAHAEIAEPQLPAALLADLYASPLPPTPLPQASDSLGNSPNTDSAKICVEQRQDASLVLYNAGGSASVPLPVPPDNRPAPGELCLLDDCLLLMLAPDQLQRHDHYDGAGLQTDNC